MSDYETIQRRRNIVVGVFVIAGMCALVWLIFKFGDLPVTASKLGAFQISVQFPMAQGVQRDTPVRFCGYQVGRVTHVEPPHLMEDQKTGKVYEQTKVWLSIDNRFKKVIPDDVDAKLMTRGFGSSFIELKITDFDVKGRNKPLLADCKDPLQGSTGVSSEFISEEIQGTIKTLVDNANHILGDPNTQENLRLTIARLADRLKQAEQTLEQINETFGVASVAIEEARPTITEITTLATTGTKTLKSVDAKAEMLVAAVADTSGQLSRSLSELRAILQKVNSGDGSAARFLNDGKFYETMLENAEEMEMLLKEIRAFVSRARVKGLPLKLK